MTLMLLTGNTTLRLLMLQSLLSTSSLTPTSKVISLKLNLYSSVRRLRCSLYYLLFVFSEVFWHCCGGNTVVYIVYGHIDLVALNIVCCFSLNACTYIYIYSFISSNSWRYTNENTIQWAKHKKMKLYYIRYLNTMCVLSVQGCRLNTDSLVQCGYEVRFTNVKAYEATAYTSTINGSSSPLYKQSI